MLTKAALLGILLASTPICFVATTGVQDPVLGPDVATTPGPDDIHALRQTYDQELQKLRSQLRDARDELGDLRGELSEALDRMQAGWQVRHSNCHPSRQLLTDYQWLRRHGHAKRAQGALDAIVKRHGRGTGSMNRLAWSLMTDKDTAGQFDELALALAERMQATDRHLDHRQLDTVALAKFLGGKLEEAVALERQAIEHGGDGEYRRRLRTYEAALAALAHRAGDDDDDRDASDRQPSLHD